MLKFSRQFALLLVAVFALAGCGGGSHHVTSRSASTTTSTARSVQGVPPTAVNGHPCTPNDEAMQCVLAKQPPPGRALPPRTTFSAQGVDFAWSCPVIAGKQFGASYFSPDTSKNWTLACVNRYRAAGQATVGVYESSANRATQGFNAGFTDAFNARNQARAVGEPDTRPIDYATDCDCTVSSILAYYQGADAGTASILHISHAAAVQLVGIYGGYFQVMGMFNAGVVGHTNWATYAWSGGRWPPASVAPLEQYLNDNSVDYDRALAPDYGQMQYTPPVVGPTPQQLAAWYSAMIRSLFAYHAHACTLPVMGSGVCGQLAWRVIHFGVLNLNGKRLKCFGPHAIPGAYLCQIVRLEAAEYSRARANSQQAYDRLGCGGPVTFPRPTNSPPCNRLRQRVKFFDAKAKALVKEF